MPEAVLPTRSTILTTILALSLAVGPATASAGTEAATSGGSGVSGTAAILASTVALALFARRR